MARARTHKMGGSRSAAALPHSAAATVTMREWLSSDRAQRREWRSLRATATLIAKTAAHSRKVTEAAEAALRRHQTHNDAGSY
jgi:hypothetical protein